MDSPAASFCFFAGSAAGSFGHLQQASAQKLAVDSERIVMHGQRAEGRHQVHDTGQITGIASNMEGDVQSHDPGVQRWVDAVTELDCPGAVAERQQGG